MQITKEIFSIGGNQLTSPEDATIYLINFDGHVALVDAGSDGAQDQLLANIQACGVNLEQIEYLLITHCHYDHTGGAKALKDRLNCRIAAHELETPFLEQGDNVVTAAQRYGARMQPFLIDHQVLGGEEEIPLGGRLCFLVLIQVRPEKVLKWFLVIFFINFKPSCRR